MRTQGRTAGHRAASHAKLQRPENNPAHKTLGSKRQLCSGKALSTPPTSTTHISFVGYEVSVAITYLKLYHSKNYNKNATAKLSSKN